MGKRDHHAVENIAEAAGKRLRVTGPRAEEQEPAATTADSGKCDASPENIKVTTPRAEEQDVGHDSSQTTTSATAQSASDVGPSSGKSTECQTAIDVAADTMTAKPAETKVAKPDSDVGARKQQSSVPSSKRTHNTATPATSFAVQTVIPRPTAHVLDDVQIKPYGDAVRKRLKDLSEYVNEGANTYALAKLLPKATWGTYAPGADHRKVLCNPATNKPIVVWIVGHIMSLWFAKNGYAERQGSITVLPLSTQLAKQSSVLMAGLSSNIPKPSPEDTINAIRAITWQSASIDSPPELFTNVYDATEAFRAKSVMPGYDVMDLEKDDLVLIECKLTRYQAKSADSKAWTQRAQMELQAISLIHKKLDRTETEGSSEDEIEDVCI